MRERPLQLLYGLSISVDPSDRIQPPGTCTKRARPSTCCNAPRREMHGQERRRPKIHQAYLKPHAFSLPQNRKEATSCVDDVVPTRACRKIEPPVTLPSQGRLLEGRTGDRSRCPVTLIRQPVSDSGLARMFRLCTMKLLFSRRSSLVCHAMPCMEGIKRNEQGSSGHASR